MKRKIQPPTVYLTLLLIILLFGYLVFAFMGSMVFTHSKRLPGATGTSLFFLEAYNTGVYYVNTLASVLFIPAIDIEKIDIPIYNVYIKQEKLDRLNKDLHSVQQLLPESSQMFVSGDLIFEDNTYPIKAKYRGVSFTNWYFKKKSWRVKLKDHNVINSSNKFNLINPKFAVSIRTPFAYTIADNLDLLAPRSHSIALFLNNKYDGVYQYTDQIDESFIRMKDRVPGDIIYGDYNNKEGEERVNIFDHPTLWEVKTTFDGNFSRANNTFQTFLSTIQNATNNNFYQLFNKHLGRDYLKFYAFNILINDEHVSEHHNHKFYFNPTNGFFEPIVWDQIPFHPYQKTPLTQDHNDLFMQLSFVPEFVHTKNTYVFDFMQTLTEEKLFSDIDEVADSIRYELYHDKYKTMPIPPWRLTNKAWERSLEEMKHSIKERYLFLQKELNETNVTVFSIDNDYLVFDVQGNVGISWKISNNNLDDNNDDDDKYFCLNMYQDINLNYQLDEDEQNQKNTPCPVERQISNEILYPGKGLPLRYVYFFDELGETSNLTVDALNAITGNKAAVNIIQLDSLKDLPSEMDTQSLHPWTLQKQEKETIILSGDITLNKDMIISPLDTLVIEPGTTIKLDEGISIIAYGKVIAQGTEEEPIQFVPLTEKPWGAIALQGEGSKGSIFSHCVFEGGSGAKYRLVHYTGMLSTYNTQLKITDCSFRKNKVEDDAFNAKFSDVEMTRSDFEDTFGDAVDFDFSTGFIIDSHFVNSGNDAIDIMTSDILIAHNTLDGFGDKGISVGEKSSPSIEDNYITNGNIGIAIKDRSNTKIINTTLKDNTIGITAYEKNWRYNGGGTGTIIGADYCSNEIPLLIQNRSHVDVETNADFITCTAEKCLNICEEKA
jgi:parallel beta-helix repeat protein